MRPGPKAKPTANPSSGEVGALKPRMPERTRLMRPNLWIDSVTARLSDAAFRAYLGLTTCADDAGWLLWEPSTLAAQLARFERVDRRERNLVKATDELAAAGLITVHPCGCAVLPYLARDFGMTGGNHNRSVVTFHQTHLSLDEYVPIPTSPASVSASGSDSGLPSVPTPHAEPLATSNSRTNRTEEVDPWSEFEDPRWWPVREAIQRRGYHLPPAGLKDHDGTQRDRLWQLVRENSEIVAKLIDTAPPDLRAGARPFFDLVGHVFRGWNSMAREQS